MVVVAYKVPGSIDAAVFMLGNADRTVKILAGGTDVIIQSRSQNSEPITLVDIKQIDSMVSADLDAQGLRLGPAMPCAELTARKDIKAVFPGFIEAADLIGGAQVQGRCSVGGNLCNASPAADTIPALVAIGAECVIAGSGGQRTVRAEDFVTGVGQHCMASDELLQHITVAMPAPGTSDAYLRFIPRTEMDIAVAGAGVSVTLDATGTCTAARVCIGAVATTALLVEAAATALLGTRLEETALQAAAAAASAAARPISDRRGTAEYRRQLVGVLVKRAAVIAARRAKEKWQ